MRIAVFSIRKGGDLDPFDSWTSGGADCIQQLPHQVMEALIGTHRGSTEAGGLHLTKRLGAGGDASIKHVANKSDSFYY